MQTENRSEPVRTLPAALRGWARESPDRVALRHGAEQLTYAELDTGVDRVAITLAARGVAKGDRVVLIGQNSVAWVVAYLACLRLGVVVAPANNRLNPGQLSDQCELTEAKAVLYDASTAELVRDSAQSDREVIELGELLRRADDSAEPAAPALPDAPSPGDLALISFTSGTTGVPKGAMLSHEALFKGALAVAEFHGSTQDDSTLVLVPIFHNTGFNDQFGHMLVVGGRTHLLTKYRTADAIAELRERPVTFLAAVPSILRMLMMSEEAEHIYGPASKLFFGGSPMPATWIDELLDRWPHLRLTHAYGLSEFTSIVSFLPHELVASKGESVGLPAPRVQLKVVDGQGRRQSPGVTGEVWVSGPTRMTGYWRQPGLTEKKFKGEWLRTGDLGYLDDEGLLWLTGRVDDVINRGGEKILPSFVESCIAQRPDVGQVVVFGIDDPVLQQRVAAAVEPRPNTLFDERAARDHLAQRLPDYAVPERWTVYDKLPLTASGKVDRREVARRFSHHAASGVPDV
ncbi:acyl--CoA ligase [Streptomyces prunicolor]|uniref:class I adenylate-forming enzyme family protein n=1 Tax=Streptomyces prunicolor TaxID=67348 RepID=UPI002259A601|nr:class I adenylate-forming enzyme family protein [Streptomyces prunicolor]MCX5240408.1 acyl--CoA ligase [Streptomyces prunicolor]